MNVRVDWTAMADRGSAFLGLTALMFAGLKLAGKIAWSWWWVTAPLWGPAAVAVVTLAGMFVAAFTWTYVEEWMRRRALDRLRRDRET